MIENCYFSCNNWIDRGSSSFNSKDFVDNLLPSNKEAIEKDGMLYVCKVVKEKSNLLDRQLIDIGDDTDILENEKDMYGNIHEKSIMLRYSGNVTYNANREFSKLKLILTVQDGYSGGGIIQIESKQGGLYTLEEILSTTEPVAVDIPINNASSITIRQISGVITHNMVTDAILYNEE